MTKFQPKKLSALIFSLLLCLTGIARAQDITNLGGDLTSILPGRSAIQVNAPNVIDEDRRLLQLSGFSVFHGLFAKGDGLGPQFLSDSCGGCHVNNGRGPLRFSNTRLVGTTMVLKVSVPGLNANGSPHDLPGVGQQIQDHSVSGSSGQSVKIIWRDVPGSYPDGTKYKLRRPDLRVRLNNIRISARKLLFSLRMTPPVIGPGLLEAVPDSELEALSDPTDANHDGISGKPNYVLNARNSTYSIGRFGFRGSNPTVEQQSAGALVNDMGVTNPIFHDPALAPELNEENLRKLTIYQKLAGVPIARSQDDPHVISGKAIFQQIGCDACHKVTLTTSLDAEDLELRNQTIHPFTDLLLHDMGRDLADKRAEFSAKGSEWKTTPLWGLGFTKRLSSVRAFYIHDGRARSVEEAILWHGGEGANSRKAFKKLSKSDRSDLLKFLDSL